MNPPPWWKSDVQNINKIWISQEVLGTPEKSHCGIFWFWWHDPQTLLFLRHLPAQISALASPMLVFYLMWIMLYFQASNHKFLEMQRSSVGAAGFSVISTGFFPLDLFSWQCCLFRQLSPTARISISTKSGALCFLHWYFHAGYNWLNKNILNLFPVYDTFFSGCVQVRKLDSVGLGSFLLRKTNIAAEVTLFLMVHSAAPSYWSAELVLTPNTPLYLV